MTTGTTTAGSQVFASSTSNLVTVTLKRFDRLRPVRLNPSIFTLRCHRSKGSFVFRRCFNQNICMHYLKIEN